MPTDTDTNTETTDTSTVPQNIRIRLWPAVGIVVIHLAVTFITLQAASTNIQNMIGLALAPIVSLIALSLWWIVGSGVPRGKAAAGLVMVLVALGIIVMVHGANGVYLLVKALPVMTTGAVVLLLLTQRVDWHRRRSILLAGVLIVTTVFVLQRVDAVGGDLIPQTSWRWTPTSEELLASSQGGSESDPHEVAELPTNAGSGDWTSFRGPHRDGSVSGVTFATNWDEDPPRELWRRRVGLGWSSFAAVGEYIFTQEQRGGDEIVICYRAATGEPVWLNRSEARFEDTMGSGPRGTPTFHNGKLYVQGATGIVQCLDSSTGETIWQRDLMKDTNAKLPMWGFASSPLVSEGLVTVFTGADNGKSVVAYDAESGELAWSAGSGNHGYCSTHLAKFDDVAQLLMVSNFGIQSFTPKSGEKLWEHAWKMGSQARVVQPMIVDNEAVLIGTSFAKGTRRVRISHDDGNWKAEEEWTVRKFRPYFNDFVLHEGHCYGFDGDRLTCIDAETGDLKWKGERLGGQVLLLKDMEALLVVTEKGNVLVVEASPDEFREVARFKAIDGKTWNHPVIANGRLFVRNSDEAACFELPVIGD